MTLTLTPSAVLLERTAYHEAGHAVVALHHGFPVQRVALSSSPTPELRGWCSYSYAPERHFAREQTEQLILATLAGPLAEEKRFGSPGGDAQDREHALRLARILRPEREQGAVAFIEWMEVCTRSLLATPRVWERVERLAAELLRRQTLTGEEVRKVCGLPTWTAT